MSTQGQAPRVVFSNGKGTQATDKPAPVGTIPMPTATEYNRSYGSVGALAYALGQMKIKGGKKKTRKSLKKHRKTRRK
jgi:hypothetical protein